MDRIVKFIAIYGCSTILKMAPSAILDFQNFKVLAVDRGLGWSIVKMNCETSMGFKQDVKYLSRQVMRGRLAFTHVIKPM